MEKTSSSDASNEITTNFFSNRVDSISHWNAIVIKDFLQQCLFANKFEGNI